jgi:ADP-ribose pyrophosphatase YjhB (NUDIX family)
LTLKQRFFFCPKCGARLFYEQLGERQRLVCSKCRYVMYENPIVGVACIIVNNRRILLGRRSADTTYPGLWCIPCGYVEYDEDVWEAAKREFFEETGLTVELDNVFTVKSNWHNPEVHTVGIWFWAHVVTGEITPGDDIDQVEYFPFDELPPLAFATDKQVIAMIKS